MQQKDNIKMNSEIEKKIFEIHTAFLSEYSQATVALSEFYKTITSFFSSMACGLETQPNEKTEDNIRVVQDVCFFLKTFCSEIELHTQLMQSKGTQEIDPDVIEDLVSEVDTEYHMPESPNEIYPVELYPDIFDYKVIDPSTFVAGDIAEFFISFVKDDASYLFFMMSASSADVVIQQPEFRYDIIPSKGTVFGLQLDGVIFRAVRENVLPTRPKKFKVFLIDVGEIVEITKDYKMYRLTEDMQQVPGQSIYCKLSTKDENEDSDNESYLREKLFTKQFVRIDRVYKNMLEVSIMPRSKPAIPPRSSRQPFLAQPSSTSASTAQNTNLTNLSNENAPRNCEMPPLIRNNCNDGSGTGTIISGNNKAKENNLLTQEELDELNEEPLNTENAMVAIMGYDPKDDRRICKFTDPRTNACFKGRHCKLEHTTKLKDGWTKDQRMFKANIHNQVPMPRVGKKIQLFVQYVEDIDKFFCHIVPKNCKDADDLPAEHIFEELNDPKATAKFRKFVVPPAEFELVFALYSGDWYRARIMQKFSDLEYRVFFVDYGNCENKHIDNMRRWEDAFDRYPFQAIECKLDNIIKLKKRDTIAVAMFEKLVFRKVVTATVTSNAGILLITMELPDVGDIGEMLCAEHFATAKPVTRFLDTTYPG